MKRSVQVVKLVMSLSLVLAGSAGAASKLPSPKRCNLNIGTYEQARCLLSPVGKYANIGKTLDVLPSPWPSLLGDSARPVPSVSAFANLLQSKAIPVTSVIGDLSGPISKNSSGLSLRYFVIHDTSSLIKKTADGTFPTWTNEHNWSSEQLINLSKKKNAHIFIGRTGDSIVAVDPRMALATTKFEIKNKSSMVGLFLGVENIQPRMLDAKKIDSIAPSPGFTPAQMERMALVYVAASIRANRWLIPAFHAVLDEGIPNGHDDPQNFDLGTFSSAVEALIQQLKN